MCRSHVGAVTAGDDAHRRAGQVHERDDDCLAGRVRETRPQRLTQAVRPARRDHRRDAGVVRDQRARLVGRCAQDHHDASTAAVEQQPDGVGEPRHDQRLRAAVPVPGTRRKHDAAEACVSGRHVPYGASARVRSATGRRP